MQKHNVLGGGNDDDDDDDDDYYDYNNQISIAPYGRNLGRRSS